MSLSPTLFVEIKFAGFPNNEDWLYLDDSARGILDTNTLGDTETWVDVTEWAFGFTTERGSRRVDGPIVHYEAGSASIRLDNTDRRFDPTNLAGPYVSGGVTQIEPMREVRIRATYGAVTYQLFRGYADAWSVTYDPPEDSQVMLEATDGFKVFSNYDRAASGAIGGGEKSGARITRILDAVGWPAGSRIVGTGVSTLQATTGEGDALTEALLVTDTEIGEFYIDGASRAVFRDRRALSEDARSATSQATFGDVAGELEYDDVTIEYDDATLYNHARITRAGGVEQVITRSSSVAKYLVHTFEKSELLMETDAEALDYAGYVLHITKDPELRFAELVIDPQGTTAFEDLLYPEALGRDIGDRITIKRRPPGGGDPIERDVFIRGIKHEVDARESTWKTSWALQSSTKHAWMTLDNSTLGKLDENALSY